MINEILVKCFHANILNLENIKKFFVSDNKLFTKVKDKKILKVKRKVICTFDHRHKTFCIIFSFLSHAIQIDKYVQCNENKSNFD